MIRVLPIDASSPAYTVDVDLSGTLYRLEVAWNTRGGWWSLGIRTAADEPIALGARIVADFPLFRACNDPRMPPGQIIGLDLTEQGADPTYASLGSDFVVVYDDG